jgi:Secretion system C-terminal sorting domain
MCKFLTALFFLVLTGVIISGTQLPDTLSNSVKGTTMPNRSYVVKDSIDILAGDTLTVSPGDTLYMMNDPVTGAACWIHILGTFICDGTPTSHIVITTAYIDSAKHPGMWGGIVGDSCKYVNVQYAEVSWAGGNDASGHSYRTFDISSDYANTTNTVFSYNTVYGTVDDCIGLHGGNASVTHNTLRWVGDPDGDNFNIKSGCVGEIAYNVIWAGGGNGIKMNADPSLPRITNMCIHNNTIVATGWRRRPEVGYGILVDESARAEIYNNIFCDDYGDIEITPVADTARTVYENNLFAYSLDSLKGAARYYPSDGVGKPASGDIMDVKASDLFASYTAGLYNDWTMLDGSNDYHLMSNAPALGKGITPPAPTASNHWGNPYFGNGTQTLPGDANIGAFGTSGATAIKYQDANVISKFQLSQNYPNPFNPSTNISYSLKESGRASLQIYNVLGELVMTVDQGYRQGGQTYSFNINMDHLSSGIYFYTLREGSNIMTKKMVLLK